jgi:hypothetical protein
MTNTLNISAYSPGMAPVPFMPAWRHAAFGNGVALGSTMALVWRCSG